MFRFNALKRSVIPMIAGSALALALLVGAAQAAPAGAAPFDLPAPDAWPSKLEIGAYLAVWPKTLEIGS